MIAAEPAAAIEGLKRLTAACRCRGDLADGLAMERDILGGLYRSEIGQQRVKAFADKSAARAEKAVPMSADDDYRGLGWAHGALAVQRLGAMLAPVTFLLADGRQVSPMHVAPWADEPEAEALPGILRRLRGEWPCVPFGYSVPADGWPAEWASVMGAAGSRTRRSMATAPTMTGHWLRRRRGSLSLALDYPAGKPGRARRTDGHARSVGAGHRPRIHDRRCAVPAACRSACTRCSGCRQQPAPPRWNSALRRTAAPIRHDVEPGAALFARNRTLRRPRRACRRAPAAWSTPRGCRLPPIPRNCCRSTASTARRRSPTTRTATASGSPGRRSISQACCSGTPIAAARQRRGTGVTSRSASSRSARPSGSVRRPRWPTIRSPRSGTADGARLLARETVR